MERICKTDSQGAATTVWAAIGDYWEGKGGKYLEDCQVSAPFDASNLDAFIGSPGYAPHAYDEEAAKQLWKLSNELVGFKEDWQELLQHVDFELQRKWLPSLLSFSCVELRYIEISCWLQRFMQVFSNLEFSLETDLVEASYVPGYRL